MTVISKSEISCLKMKSYSKNRKDSNQKLLYTSLCLARTLLKNCRFTLTLGISIMKLKILTAVCIVSGLIIPVNAQITTISINHHAATKNIVNPNISSSQNRILPAYKIETRRGVTHFSIHRFSKGNEVRIKIMQNAVENNDIEDFNLAYDSGNEYRMGNLYGIENITFPLYVKVTYRSWNAFHTGRYDVTFEFTINNPGVWNVTIFN